MRLRAFLESLASLPVALDLWFLEGEYLGKPALWDARGGSPLLERRLSGNLQEVDLQQGLPVIRSTSIALVDGGSPRNATCSLVNVANSVPIPAWFPCRLELEFTVQEHDILLGPSVVTEMVRKMVEAFRPWWGFLDPSARTSFDSEDLFYGRPLVGRATYLARDYGSPQSTRSARVVDCHGGALLLVDGDRFQHSDDQDAAVLTARRDLAEAGLLLTRTEYESRLR